MLIYFDSVIVIYLLAHIGTFQVLASTRLASATAAADQFAVSDLTRLECRVRPIALGDQVKLAGFDAFFARPDVQRAPLTTKVYDRATALRAHHKFKLADSLHLAAAIEGGCNRFVTNDYRLSRCTEIAVEVLT